MPIQKELKPEELKSRIASIKKAHRNSFSEESRIIPPNHFKQPPKRNSMFLESSSPVFQENALNNTPTESEDSNGYGL